MIDEIKERWAKAQKGPWMWDVNMACHSAHLTTTHSGRLFILGFLRWGMQSAQPEFQKYNKGIVYGVQEFAVPRQAHHPNFDMDIDHPDAAAIANAPTDIAYLLQEIERLKCCGNCKNWAWHISRERMGCSKSPTKRFTLSNDKCSDWALKGGE